MKEDQKGIDEAHPQARDAMGVGFGDVPGADRVVVADSFADLKDVVQAHRVVTLGCPGIVEPLKLQPMPLIDVLAQVDVALPVEAGVRRLDAISMHT